MKIYYNKTLISNFGLGYLFLDTSSLIAIINYEKLFSDFLAEIEQTKRTLVTIPSIIFEFTRTDSIDTFNTRVKFINKYVQIYPIEKHLEQFRPLIPILQKVNGKMSYSDFLLYCCLHHFNGSLLLTENHKDFLISILNREMLITLDIDDPTIRNTAIYSFNYEKYEKAAEGILRKYNV